MAEKLKISHASAVSRKDKTGISFEYDGDIHSFQVADIDEIVEARLEELFEAINKELKRAGRAGKLPNGAVLTGGTAQLKGIVEYTKLSLGLAARIGVATGYGGVVDNLDKPDFATALGLMLIDSESGGTANRVNKNKGQDVMSNGINIITKLMGRFRA